MDYIRVTLISALAIVSYLLLLAWNEDYHSPANAQAPRSAVAEQQVGLPAGPADLPAPPSGAEDLPAVAPAQPAAAQNAAPANALISVSTPLHEVNIDLRGGDIVHLSLPRHPVSLANPDQPFPLLYSDASGVYVAQTGLIGQDGPDADPAGRPLYSSSSQAYVLPEGGEQLVVDLTYSGADAVTITKRFTFRSDDYLIGVDYLVDNQSAAPWSGNLFGQIKRDGAPDPSSASGFGVRTYLGAALTTRDDPYLKINLDDIDDGSRSLQETGGWIAFSQHYFLSAWVPQADQLNSYSLRKNSNGEYIMGFTGPATTVAPGSSGSLTAAFWAGPKDQDRLEEIAPDLGLTIDYGWLWFIAYPIHWLLTHIDEVIGNYGWSIIALTVLIKLAFMRLSAASYRSMAKMRRLTPQITEMRERYGDDKQKLMQAQMDLWRKEKVNPMGGCLPMLLQMPVLIGMYWVLNESVELRQAPWILWYQDLSAMDPFFILPLIMGGSMYVSQMMTPMTVTDPVQAKVLRFMPVLFTVFFLWFPAGLVLYWLVSNVFNIAQQWYVNKKVDESYARKAG